MLAQLAQPWRMRYPLIRGDGNFGSVDGDPPADARYTQVKREPLARELGSFPHLLVNGSGDLPPHNLREVAAALREGAGTLPGPDFPGGGVIADPENARKLYSAGAAEFRLRARAHVEGDTIVVTELPHLIEKGGEFGVIHQIVTCVSDRRIAGIADLQDATDCRGMRLVIVVRTDPHAILDALYEQTSLEVIVNAELRALVDGEPRSLTLEELLAGYDPDEVDRIAGTYGDARRTALIPPPAAAPARSGSATGSGRTAPRRSGPRPPRCRSAAATASIRMWPPSRSALSALTTASAGQRPDDAAEQRQADALVQRQPGEVA